MRSRTPCGPPTPGAVPAVDRGRRWTHDRVAHRSVGQRTAACLNAGLSPPAVAVRAQGRQPRRARHASAARAIRLDRVRRRAASDNPIRHERAIPVRVRCIAHGRHRRSSPRAAARCRLTACGQASGTISHSPGRRTGRNRTSCHRAESPQVCQHLVLEHVQRAAHHPGCPVRVMAGSAALDQGGKPADPGR